MKYLKPHFIILALAFIAFAASIFVGEEVFDINTGDTYYVMQYSHVLQLSGFVLGFLGFLLFSLRRRKGN